MTFITKNKDSRHRVVVCCISLLILSILIASLTGCRRNNDGIVDAKVDLTPTDELIIYIPNYQYFNSNFSTIANLLRWGNDAINVTIERFGDADDYLMEQYQSRLSTELMAGTGPDIIFTQYFNDIYKTIDSGLFLNLNEIIEQDDDFNLDDYYAPVMDAGIYKGGRYVIPLSFNVPIMLSEQGMLDKIGFDLSKNTDFISFLTEATNRMPAVREINPRGTMVISLLSHTLLNISGIKLVDFENGTILPDEESFRRLCEAFKLYYEYDFTSSYDYTTMLDLFTDGTMFFYGSFASFGHLFNWGHLMSSGYEPVYTGIKDMQGGLHATVDQGVAIRAGSKNQLNAWNFIKRLLWEETQYARPGSLESGAFGSNVVNKAALERKIDYFGLSSISVGFYEGVFLIPIIPEEDRQQLKDLINSITSCSLDYNLSIHDVITSEFFWPIMGPYFNGDQTYDEAVEQLKQRLRFYISE